MIVKIHSRLLFATNAKICSVQIVIVSFITRYTYVLDVRLLRNESVRCNSIFLIICDNEDNSAQNFL